MPHSSVRPLRMATAAAERYLNRLLFRPVAPTAHALQDMQALDGPLQFHSIDASAVVEELDRHGSAATMATAGGRFFGLVVGGALPATVGARVLTTAWDQIVFSPTISPVGCLLERVAGRWVQDLLHLPPSAHTSFVTGATMGNFSCLAAAREHLLQRAGYSVREQGLWQAPRIRIVASEQIHVTVVKALTLLGWGTANIERVATDEQGRLIPEALPELDDNTIVILQAGNVNSGAFDPFAAVCQRARQAGSWVHVDGAFGAWAAASAHRQHLTHGMEQAHSWVVDGHKWLNTPYDCAMAIVSEPLALHHAMQTQAPYLKEGGDVAPKDMAPEFSRSARGVEVWAALRSLGRQGLHDLIERCCAHAQHLSLGLQDIGFEVLNDVVLNQVVAAFGSSAEHEQLVQHIQGAGDCWFGLTHWRGRSAIRLSVANWSTSDMDIERTLKAIRMAMPARLHTHITTP